MNSTKSVFLRSKKRTAASGSPSDSLNPSILLTLGLRKGFASPLGLTQAGGVLGITQNELESIAFSSEGSSGPLRRLPVGQSSSTKEEGQTSPYDDRKRKTKRCHVFSQWM